MKVAAVGASLFLASALFVSAPSQAQNVVTDWNAIASTTIVANGKKASATSGVWFAYSSIAAYDAVNAVRHDPFEPFYFHGSAPEGASEDAPAIAAAHPVLLADFPAQHAPLHPQSAAALQQVAASARSKDAGVSVGEEAAKALLAARSGDGLEANTTYTPGSGPGVWQPTPPGFLPALTPWVGQMRPFTM